MLNINCTWKTSSINNRHLEIMRNSNFETGIKMEFIVNSFKKLPKKGLINDRGIVSMSVRYNHPVTGDIVSLDLEKVPVSSAIARAFKKNPESYISKSFVSTLTDPDWKLNPLKIVKSNDKYFLYFVHDNGYRHYEVMMPGGIAVPKIAMKVLKPSEFRRFVYMDHIRSINSK